MLVDSHCHLDFFAAECIDSPPPSASLPKLAKVLENARQAQVEVLVTVATNLDKQQHLLSLCIEHEPHYPKIFCSVGTHPTYLDETPPPTCQALLSQLEAHSKIIAIGESGLDFFRPNNPSRNTQLRAFAEHILAAQECAKQAEPNQPAAPLIVHNREADSDIERILAIEQKRQPFPCVLHCFAASTRLADAALEMGCSLSFTGLVTYPKCQHIRDIVKTTPLSRMMLETDAPFLAPVPHRSRACEPALLPFTAKRIAEIKQMPLKTLITQTGENFLALFPRAAAAGL